MEDEYEIQMMPTTHILKDLLEIRTMMIDNGLDTVMIDDTIKKEVFIIAVDTDKTFRTVEAEYNKAQAKEKLSVVKPIK